MTVLTSLEQEEIQYPSSDGEPMAESDITRDYMTYGVEALKLHFQGRSDVYVSANSFVYYEEGNKAAVVAPDIYVVFGVRKRQRDNYKIWKEAGIAPQFVLEITSETTQDVDQETKPEIYESLGVREYFQYDPSGDYLNPILQGLRLVNNRYEPIPVNNIALDTLWLYSEVLGLELHLVSGELRFRNPQTGEFLKTYQQSEQARLAAEQAQMAAESALRSLISHLLNSGMNLEQVAQMMNLSPSEVERLIAENELAIACFLPFDYSLGSTGSLSIANTPKTHS
jgi:Uma2 family endonuclease